jgi:hypothetical protein
MEKVQIAVAKGAIRCYLFRYVVDVVESNDGLFEDFGCGVGDVLLLDFEDFNDALSNQKTPKKLNLDDKKHVLRHLGLHESTTSRYIVVAAHLKDMELYVMAMYSPNKSIHFR